MSVKPKSPTCVSSALSTQRVFSTVTLKFAFTGGAHPMGNSLLEQLKKSGLVDKNKAQQVKQSQKKSQKQKTKRGAPAKVDEAQLLVQQARAGGGGRGRGRGRGGRGGGER